jgi:hypothetical protein
MRATTFVNIPTAGLEVDAAAAAAAPKVDVPYVRTFSPEPLGGPEVGVGCFRLSCRGGTHREPDGAPREWHLDRLGPRLADSRRALGFPPDL